jgi:methylmalonyl-CoA mutase, C-terminal domain
MPRPLKVLIAKAGLDGHERGALVVAMGLRDAGMEVVYTGIRNTPEQIVASAIQEDVDAIGLSSLSGGHMAQFSRVMELLKKNKPSPTRRGSPQFKPLVFAGGIIPDDDAKKLKKLGIREVFGPGSSIASIVEFLNGNVGRSSAAGK